MFLKHKNEIFEFEENVFTEKQLKLEQLLQENGLETFSFEEGESYKDPIVQIRLCDEKYVILYDVKRGNYKIFRLRQDSFSLRFMPIEIVKGYITTPIKIKKMKNEWSIKLRMKLTVNIKKKGRPYSLKRILRAFKNCPK